MRSPSIPGLLMLGYLSRLEDGYLVQVPSVGREVPSPSRLGPNQPDLQLRDLYLAFGVDESTSKMRPS